MDKNISSEKIQEWEEETDTEINTILKNSITNVGSILSTTDSDRINEINYEFIDSIRKKTTKCTDQGQSGRCWIFAGLNMFRHHIIHAFNLDNFEFSETYLFFWDKLERVNTFLDWYIETEIDFDSEVFKYMFDSFLSDGGWWNMFSSLVKKYGVIPKTNMKETFSSMESFQLTETIKEKLVNFILSQKNKKDLKNNKDELMKEIYNLLTIFLGQPPKKVNWECKLEDSLYSIKNISPLKFAKIISPIKINNFIVLSNIPTLKYNTLYEFNHTKNIVGDENGMFLNVRMEDMIKYAKKSISEGVPVWTGLDMTKEYNPYYSVLDDKSFKKERLVGKRKRVSKKDKIRFRNLSANHAVTLTAVKQDKNGKPISWQVENSWGYWDNSTPGEDGFIVMSGSWFKKNVLEIVVNKDILSRTLKKLLKKKPIQIDPWSSVGSSLMLSNNIPSFFMRLSKKRRKNRCPNL